MIVDWLSGVKPPPDRCRRYLGYPRTSLRHENQQISPRGRAPGERPERFPRRLSTVITGTTRDRVPSAGRPEGHLSESRGFRMSAGREREVALVGDGYDAEPLLTAGDVGTLLKLPAKSVYELPIS